MPAAICFRSAWCSTRWLPARNHLPAPTRWLRLEAVLTKKPVPPLKLNPKLPPDLEGIIGHAMEKNRANRYPDALTLKADLVALKRETDPNLTASGRMRSPFPYRIATSTFQTTSRWQTYLLLAVSAVLVMVLTLAGLWWFKHRSGATGARNTIAVLPLQNVNGDISVDFLRFALADEIAKVLTYSRTLDVRPSSLTQKYAANDPDPQKVGRELRVATVLTGHFLKQGDNLMVTLEAIDVRDNRLLWQSSFTAPAQDLIALQSNMAAQIRQGLLPTAGRYGRQRLPPAAVPRTPRPTISTCTPWRCLTIPDRIKMRSRYCSKWCGWIRTTLRHGRNWDCAPTGTPPTPTAERPMFQLSNTACERALALDPNLTIAAGQLITNRVERGELGKAYEAAQALVKRRPESAQAHFVLSYVYRYAGMLEEATRANAIRRSGSIRPITFSAPAPGPSWSWARPDRAADFIRLDAGSEWAAYVTPSLLLREGKIAEAREAVKRMPTAPRYHRDLLESCLGLRPEAELDRIAHESETSFPADPDPETWYYEGALFAYCGKTQAAVHLLQSAIQNNYCSYSNLLTDPLLAKFRADPAIDKLLTSARECQEAVRQAAAGQGK